MRHQSAVFREGRAMQQSVTILIIPGLRDHVEEHWQTFLAKKLPHCRTVPPMQTDKLNLEARIDAIEQQLASIEGPVILVAHSAGVLMTVHWAARFTRPILGALLVAPPDLNAQWPENYPTPASLQQLGWSPVPNQPLPFPSILVASSNDYLASLAAATQMAEQWGSRFYNAGDVGHLNPASGYGEWPLAEQLIDALKQ